MNKSNNKIDVYFVRHAESCSNISSMFSLGQISHPPLSYLGIQQAIYLSINNKIIDKDFDAYYCSPSLRTIMTACLALRKKANTRDPSYPIQLILNPYLIEKRYIGEIDQQNSIVPKKNLKKMIKYLKLWFKEHYFNNYMDYEFVHIMYDLVRLLNYDNNLTKYKELIKNLLKVEKTAETKKELLNKLINILKKEDYKETIQKFSIINTENGDDIYTKILLFIDNPSVYENVNVEDKDKDKYIEETNTTILNYRIIIEQLKTFCDDKIFMNNIIIKYNEFNNIQEHNANIQKFIDDELILFKEYIPKKDYNFLCFSHGLTLKEYFNLKSYLKNTEIIHYNINNGETKIILNNIVIKKNIKDICGSLYTPKYKMFKVIDNYFNKIKESDININNKFKVSIFDQISINSEEEKYKQKYLKYKHKYLKYFDI